MSYVRRFHIRSKVRDAGGPWYDGKITDDYPAAKLLVTDRVESQRLARKKLRHASRLITDRRKA